MATLIADGRRLILTLALHDRVPDPLAGAMVRAVAARAAPSYIPWIREFSSVIGHAEAFDYFLAVGPPGNKLRGLLLRLYSLAEADIAFPAARQLAREAPGEAKDAVMAALLAGDNPLAVLLIPEVTGYLSVAEGDRAFERVVGDALRPLDPYAHGALGDARRGAATLLATFPALLDDLVSRVGAADQTTKLIAGDLAVAALALGRNLGASHVPSFVSLLAVSLGALPAQLATADSRYSVADPLGTRSRGESAASTNVRMGAAALASYPARLFGGVGLATAVGAAAVVLPSPLERLRVGPAEIFGAAAVVIALHVLAVELAANKLPSGFVHRVSWPVRLVLAYLATAVGISAAIAAAALTSDTRTLMLRVAAISFLLLLVLLPAVVRELVGKSDALQAARRIGRDRGFDMWLAARNSTESFRNRARAEAVISTLPFVGRVSTEPASRRHLRVLAKADGFVNVNIPKLADVDAFLRANAPDDGPQAEVALLTQHGNPVRRGDVLAAVLADEPNVASRAASLVGRSVDVEAIGASLRAQETMQALSQLLHLQAVDRDVANAHRTSQIIVFLLRSYLRSIPAEGERRRGYLENMLPMTPEQQAVEGWESAYRSSIVADDENRSDFLRTHALRLADLGREFERSAALELLIARTGVLLIAMTPDTAHSIAIVLTDLARVSAELGRREAYAAARRDAERLVRNLAAIDPVPPSEQLTRQRLEELLAYGLVGDYFLEEDVFRGCDALVDLAADSQPGRKAHIHLGVCRVGGLALSSRRYSLAARLYSLLASAGADWVLIRKFSQTETVSSRLAALNSLAGGVFGRDPVAAVGRYVDWAQDLDTKFAPTA